MKLQSMQNLTRYLEYTRSFHNSSRFTVSLTFDSLSKLGIDTITSNEILNIPNVNKVIRMGDGFMVEMKYEENFNIAEELIPNKKELVESLFEDDVKESTPNNLRDLGMNLIKFFQNNIGTFVNAIKSNNNIR